MRRRRGGWRGVDAVAALTLLVHAPCGAGRGGGGARPVIPRGRRRAPGDAPRGPGLPQRAPGGPGRRVGARFRAILKDLEEMSGEKFEAFK